MVLRPQVQLQIFQMNTFRGMRIITKYSVAIPSDLVYQVLVFPCCGKWHRILGKVSQVFPSSPVLITKMPK